MPKKPTHKFGYLAFSKEGRVTPHISEFSSDKETQELQALNQFAYVYNRKYGEDKITDISPLAEKDTDFIFQVEGKETMAELTELVERDYLIEEPPGGYTGNESNWYIARPHPEKEHLIPTPVDLERWSTSLKRLVQKKIEKGYDKPDGMDFWLVIYSTSDYLTIQAPETNFLPFRRAYSLILEEAKNPFDQVWYTELLLNPTQIWPNPEFADADVQ